MLTILACLAIVLGILIFSDYLSKKNIIKNEYQRKFVHILVGIFIASWPWLMSWRSIQLIGLFMLSVVIINRYKHMFKFDKSTRRKTYGDYWFAIAIVLCALLTTNKIFFAIAILHLALADGLAAIAGQVYGKHWKYSILGQPKTILGSMVFWLTSLFIFGIFLLLTYSNINFSNYALLLLLAPPVLTFIENISIKGSDNILIPLTVLLVLNLAQLN
jgi:dolichol kinase